jgi:hypothetical protein
MYFVLTNELNNIKNVKKPVEIFLYVIVGCIDNSMYVKILIISQRKYIIVIALLRIFIYNILFL